MRHESVQILYLRKNLMLSILFFCAISTLSCQKQTATSFETTSEILQVKEIPKDWQNIETDDFSFSIPPTMKKNDVRGIDSFVMQFENKEVILDIEYGDYSQDVIKHLQDYEGNKEKVKIDGEETEVVSYDKNKPINLSNRTVNADGSTKLGKVEKNYVIGVDFPHKNEIISPEDRPAISFIAGCKNLESQETAKKILYSIKFKQK